MTPEAPSRSPQIVIAGSGPTGLALGIELANRGVRSLIVERNPRVGYAPRAKTTNVRTREHLRRWGIAHKLAEASPFGIHYPSDVHFVTRLSGFPLVRFEGALNCAPARDPRYSEHAQWIPQYKLEAVLKAHAETLAPLTIEYGHEVVDLSQNADHVAVRLRTVETGVERTITADYLVGADGARSRVRDAIGAVMHGRYGISHHYNTIFRGPGLAKMHRQGPGIMYWQVNGEAPSLLGPMDEDDLWYFMPTGMKPGTRLSEAESLQLIAKSTGIDLPYRIMSSDEWVASRLLADRYSAGRVFLAGDACHLHPPFGGFGMNMGISDGVDLGWKLAATLQGWGGAGLLASYEQERRPVHDMVMQEAEQNHSVLSNQLFQSGIENDTPTGEVIRAAAAVDIRRQKSREFFALSVILGYSYAGSPLIASEANAASAGPLAADYVPDAVPGSLAPHRWLEDGRSLYDLFGQDFTLLAIGGRAEDLAAAKRDADATGIPLRLLELDDPALKVLYDARLVLIRPDQHVAWRGDSWPGEGLLAQATGRTRRAVERLSG